MEFLKLLCENIMAINVKYIIKTSNRWPHISRAVLKSLPLLQRWIDRRKWKEKQKKKAEVDTEGIAHFKVTLLT